MIPTLEKIQEMILKKPIREYQFKFSPMQFEELKKVNRYVDISIPEHELKI